MIQLRSEYIDAELPLIFQFAQKARGAAPQDGEIISLEQGQTDLQPPKAVREEAIRFITEESIHYTAIDGTAELKAAIAKKYLVENHLDFSTSQITVATGGCQVIFDAFAVTLDLDDEVIIPTPYWTNFVQCVERNHGSPVYIETSLETNFKIDAHTLEQHISDHTKWLVLNSPGNPAGSCYSANELREICSVLDRYPNISVMFDEIYEHMIFDGKTHVNILNVRPDFKNRVLLVNGVSKSYSMTGWRLGYGCGPENLIAAMKLYRSATTSSPSAVSQAAVIIALQTPLSDLKKQVKALELKRNNFVKQLNEIPGLECGSPDGAMYVFPRCKKLIGAVLPCGNMIKNDVDFCQYLVTDARVCTVPGTALGLPGYFRMNFAVNEENLEKEIIQISSSINKLAF